MKSSVLCLVLAGVLVSSGYAAPPGSWRVEGWSSGHFAGTDHDDGEHDRGDGGKQRHDRCRHADDDDEDCGCDLAPPTEIDLGAPGVTLPDTAHLVSAFTVVNTGNFEERDVELTAIRLKQKGSVRTVPVSLPLKLGTIGDGQQAVVNADFSGGPFSRGGSYELSVRGTFSTVRGKEKHEEHERHEQCFKRSITLKVPPAAPGSGPLTMVSVNPGKVTGARFPHQNPNFGDTDNGSRWTVPRGPIVPGTPTHTGTTAMNAPIGDPPPIDFLVNNDWNIGQSTVAEPSGASNGKGVVFVTSNWFAAYSTDNGTTFNQLDPTTIFPNDAVGYCCDQIVQYVPSIDLFIWLLQGNGMRLAVASPADITNSKGTAWTYWNLTPDVFGEPTGTGFDYPDLAVGSGALYMSWDAGWPGCPTGCNSGREVVRTSLAGIQNQGTITLGYTTPSDSGNAWGGHLSQDTGDEIFWAGQNNTSSMRVYSLKEASNTYWWQDVSISSWSNSGLSSTTPDAQDWLNKLSGFPGNAVIGLTRVFNQVWFAWSAGTDNNFQQPHVEMVTIDINNAEPPSLNVSQQVQVWNNSYAFAYPALATNACTGEVGMSFEYGGNGNYENHVVGFWGDFIAYITTGSNVGTTRFGDYVTIRQTPSTDANPGNLFDAFGYGLNTPGTMADPHFAQFGRPASACGPPIG
jgi:hypothetical protein